MTLIDGLTMLLTALGLGFFAAGSLGLIRFPDTPSRLHALTKADNLGLGLVALGVALQAPGLAAILKLILIWALALFSAGVAAQLIGRVAAGRR
ncbi:cation:proton antiporter [Spiribacter vilamensis]|uniref:Multisubunit sodium/proton antiporter MrpG subunit n=1 Tax=Spiribacter vilamensis TaxID=531306 RepID=A0A4Q8D2S8_9GAMM|nr:monovalent cation/H(+) antiporter subunit G [Spiribacter vilamensis]RZU99731.1 multisubunit sodium/proton antiporter MrpG subunit [Spiribacter vilamensis]TVO61323.1 monovalent cation/H(+) antiporter subunit G [Spiribacter vilamensis]